MKVRWAEVRDETLEAVVDRLMRIARSVRLVTIADLIASTPEESTGLYFFFDDKRLAYVGKAESRAFVERIPSHFDVRPEGWFGTLLKRIGEQQKPPSAPSACVEQALDLRLALLIAKSADFDLTSTESAFRSSIHPSLNARRKLRPVKGRLAHLSDFGR